jgi:hypothetical protein
MSDNGNHTFSSGITSTAVTLIVTCSLSAEVRLD